MNSIIAFILDFVKKLAASLLPPVKEGLAHFIKLAAPIRFKDKVADLLFILGKVRIFLVFICLAVLIFTLLPQGKDVLLVVVEDVGVKHNPANLVWLLIGITIWSIITEYGARYSIYVADNSGKNLQNDRVEWRKGLQKVVALSFFVLPYLAILISLGVLYLTNTSLSSNTKNIGFGITAFSLYWLFNFVSKPYLDRKYRRERRARRKESPFWKLMMIPERELEYAEKLYGIYNNYIFSLPKETWFNNRLNGQLRIFYENIMDSNGNLNPLMPQGINDKGQPVEEKYRLISDVKRVHKDFEFYKRDSSDVDKEGLLSQAESDAGLYRWEYKIPNKFYKNLHRQLTVLSVTSLVVVLIFSMMETPFYQWVGAPGLVFLSFAAWSGIYLGLLFLDKGVLRKFPLSIRFILFVWVIISSFSNQDHPVRQTGIACCDNRPELKAHFESWLMNYMSDSSHIFYDVEDTAKKNLTWVSSQKYKSEPGKIIRKRWCPLTFVCAEGGALRTGAFSALALANIQDELRKSNFDFNNSIYAMSGVSGGAFGLGYYNAASFLNKKNELHNVSEDSLAKQFFSEDYLSPTLGKLLFGDVINLIIPFRGSIEKFDRAVELEKSWEHGYNKITNQENGNLFSTDFRKIYCEHTNYPALFINTTEVESGLQCWVTNVRADSLPLGSQRDLFKAKIKGNINYSTAINFSDRFPLISPSATLLLDESRKYHYVDGGYVENTGASTMIEIINYLKTDSLFKKYVRPTVLVLKFSDNTNDQFKNLNMFNEVNDIVSGIYNTRSGRAHIAEATLKRIAEKELDGYYVPMSLTKNAVEVPMNWIFSIQSLDNISSDIKQQLKDTASPKNLLKKLNYAIN